MKPQILRFFLLAVAAAGLGSVRGEDQIPLVDIKSVDPSIVVELRYAGSNNIAGRPLYRRDMRALVRPEVAQRLAVAQMLLRRYQYYLKIWDAYRPSDIQGALWKAARRNNYVADPSAGAGSFHSWGLAVDATLTDAFNRKVRMPTDYDNFTPAAMWRYQGDDPVTRSHLHLLQTVMRDAGFLGLRTEWWHFTIEGWEKFLPPEEAKRAAESFGPAWQSRQL